jgi:Tol biopolymer transport system component
MLSVLGDRADYGNIQLSADDARLAVAILDAERRTGDLWMYDVASGRRTQFTTHPADENWLIWSPDGQRVAFNSTRAGGLDLYLTQARGGSAEEPLLQDAVAKWPVSWSPDGRHILYVTNSPAARNNDIWVLPLEGDRQPYPFMDSSVDENWATFSPDGRWVAYSSTVSGQVEVYVVPFAGGGEPRRVSADGGFQARWRRDGREIFYLAPQGTLMATAVNGAGATFEAGLVQPLFQTNFLYPPYRAYDATADGQRFIVNTLVVTPGSSISVASADLGR